MAGTTVSAEAQERMNCNTREYMADALTTEYAEQPAGLGVTNDGTVVELWQGGGGSSWTLLLSMPNGNSCIVGAGNDWIQLETAKRRRGTFPRRPLHWDSNKSINGKTAHEKKVLL